MNPPHGAEVILFFHIKFLFKNKVKIKKINQETIDATSIIYSLFICSHNYKTRSHN